MSAYELAQLNIGVIRGPMDSPVMAEFAANLERINALADAASGFLWRLQTEAGDATAIRPFENENMLLNMSVWRDVESLLQFVYHSAHLEILRRRREWFERMSEAPSPSGRPSRRPMSRRPSRAASPRSAPPPEEARAQLTERTAA
jgi:hypothetical protein